MKLATWARTVGIHPKTAYRWFHRGTLPVPARQLESGTILVSAPAVPAPGAPAAIYARVSAPDQRADLDRQIARLTTWAGQHHYAVSRTEAEVGSGLHGRRRRLQRLLTDPEARVIIVEHRDRLARFGVDHVEAALAAQGRRLVVVDPDETTDDLVRDMIDVLTSFCARLYGRRSARTRALRALTAARSAPGGGHAHSTRARR